MHRNAARWSIVRDDRVHLQQSSNNTRSSARVNNPRDAASDRDRYRPHRDGRGRAVDTSVHTGRTGEPFASAEDLNYRALFSRIGRGVKRTVLIENRTLSAAKNPM